VLLKPHCDRSKARTSLLSEANANTIHDMHVQSEDYSILQVQGPTNQRETTYSNIQAMMKKHPEILSVSRNYLHKALIGSHDGAPDDPEFMEQWPLAAMRWTAARVQYGNRQVRPACITIVGAGTRPVATNNELGAYIKQYNALAGTSNIFRMPVSGNSDEGDIDSSITGALTGNGVDIAGSGCFVTSNPCRITMVQMTNSGSASTHNIENAIMWAIDHQKERGGPGPVNVSYGGAKLADNDQIQALGQSLLNQGDILVISAGDTNGEVYTPKHPYNPGSVVMVQASANDSTNSLLLTEVVGDPVAAPGAPQPAIINSQYNPHHFGSSFSAPLWCSAIAMLISMHPGMTAAQAHAILLNTGTPGSGGAKDPNPPHHTDPTPNWNFVVPAFDRAIQQALQ